MTQMVHTPTSNSSHPPRITVDQFSKMQIFNTDIHAALVTVEAIGIDTFGINCSIGPDLMTGARQVIRSRQPGHTGAKRGDGLDLFQLEVDDHSAVRHRTERPVTASVTTHST